ncbi:hypothetical protein, partial [Neisseria sicca]|uniref:hypothetical protein n=1 Tax=Neisseria sicca TaxID=490 RepID=UPI003C79216D
MKTPPQTSQNNRPPYPVSESSSSCYTLFSQPYFQNPFENKMLGKQQCKLSKYNFRFILPKIYTIRPYANKKVKGRLKNFRRP